MKFIDNISNKKDSIRYLSINILLSQQIYVNDGIKKKQELCVFPDNYYNKFYKTRIFQGLAFYKAICSRYL